MRRALVVLLLGATALAAEPPNPVKEQFARAVGLFDSESYAQALTQFEEVYAKTRAPAVLFNIAMTYALLGQPIEAVAKFDALLAVPGSFPADRLIRAKQLRDEESARIAHVKVVAPGETLVEVDGRSRSIVEGEVIAVNPGQRSFAVQTQGYIQWREVLTLAPGAEQTLEPKLLRSDLKPAQVRIECPLADVEVRLDGREVGRTPIPTAIGLAPGKHELSLRRDGYRTLSSSLDLAEGANETLRFDPQRDPTSPSNGTLSVNASETQAVIAIDGEPAGAAGAIELPHGRHQLVVRRDGFFPLRREVMIPKSDVLFLKVRLEPTPEFRAELDRGAAQHRLWGVTGLVVGAVVFIGGGAIVGVNRGPFIDADKKFERAKDLYKNAPTAANAALLGESAPLVTEKEIIQTAGLITCGLGAVIAAAGAFSLFTGPDVGRYDLAPAGDSLAPFSSLQLGVGPGSIALSGEF